MVDFIIPRCGRLYRILRPLDAIVHEMNVEVRTTVPFTLRQIDGDRLTMLLPHGPLVQPNDRVHLPIYNPTSTCLDIAYICEIIAPEDPP